MITCVFNLGWNKIFNNLYSQLGWNTYCNNLCVQLEWNNNMLRESAVSYSSTVVNNNIIIIIVIINTSQFVTISIVIK